MRPRGTLNTFTRAAAALILAAAVQPALAQVRPAVTVYASPT